MNLEDPYVQAPLRPQNLNRYSYVLNNPLSLVDPTGYNFQSGFGMWLWDDDRDLDDGCASCWHARAALDYLDRLFERDRRRGSGGGGSGGGSGMWVSQVQVSPSDNVARYVMGDEAGMPSSEPEAGIPKIFSNLNFQNRSDLTY